MSVLTTGMTPDFGFDIGFLESSSLRGQVQMPNFIMKFDVPLVSVGLSFERLFRNQMLFLLRLEKHEVELYENVEIESVVRFFAVSPA